MLEARRTLPSVLWGFSKASCPDLHAQRLDEGRGNDGAGLQNDGDPVLRPQGLAGKTQEELGSGLGG